MAKILVIAGGEWQCPIVKTAKEMGHYVICSNLYEKSPAFKFSDANEVSDVLDKKRNLEIAKKYMPDAVLTDQSDIAVPTVAFVAEALGLKGIGTKTANLFTNKKAMRSFCEHNGFPTPKYKFCLTINEALEFYQTKTDGKAIIKPIDSQSSRGVYIIHSEQELKYLFESSKQFSNAENGVLIEEYIDGKEFTVDGIKSENGYWVTAISKKDHFKHNSNIAKELLFRHYDEDFDYDELRNINKKMVLQMGLPFGLTHAEYKYNNGKYYLIEIAARGGGTKISSDVVPFMSGVDSNQTYINILLGKNPEIELNIDKEKCAVLGFFDFMPGKVKKINGFEKAKKIEGLRDIVLNFKEGEQIEPALDDRSRVGHYILECENYKQLREKERLLKDTITIDYEED